MSRPVVEIIMLRDADGAPDGVHKVVYKAGERYVVPDDLADCFFSIGAADPAEAHEEPQSGPVVGGPDSPGAVGTAPAEAASGSSKGRRRKG